MHLSVDVDRVTDVLLPDGWHKVDTATFGVAPVKFTWGSSNQPLAELGAIGYEFTERNVAYCGPISAVLAVRERSRA